MRATRFAALATVVVLAMVLRVAQAQVAAPPQAHNVLLVLDASMDGSAWAPVMALLEPARLRVTPVRASVGETRRVLALQDGPTVLIGYGSGGAVASEVGGDPKVSALVYVAAQAPEVGENFSALTARFPVKLDVAQPADAAPPIAGKTDAAAWREKPSFYAVSQQDQTLSPELQRFYAARMKAKTILLEGGDPATTHPREIAGLILEAAGMKPAACGAEGDDESRACAAPALPRSLAEGCKCTKGSLQDLTAP